jgi:hypothetical protein
MQQTRDIFFDDVQDIDKIIVLQMATLIAVYHSGLVIINEIGSYEFIRMDETFLLNEFLALENLIG